MTISRERVRELRDEYGPGDFYEARVISELLDALEETEGKLYEQTERAESAEGALTSCREALGRCQERGPATWTGYEALEGKLRVAIKALEVVADPPVGVVNADPLSVEIATQALQQIEEKA